MLIGLGYSLIPGARPSHRPFLFSDIFPRMNKTQRRAVAASKSLEATNKAMEVAMQALDRIEAHEKECGKRWAEAVFELKYLRDSTDAHAARWERLAWLVLGTFVATAIVHLTDLMM